MVQIPLRFPVVRAAGLLAGLSLGILILATPLAAQTELGVVDKYHEVDRSKAVPEGTLPELTLEQLRRITRYDALKVKKSAILVADKGNMRRIEPHPTDKGVWVVTSDFYRFSTLKDGVMRKGKKPLKNQPFLWIKYESRESPDGTPWLKDLVLIPLKKKKRTLPEVWPFADSYDTPKSFLNSRGMTRRRTAKVPFAHQSVVGTFKAGKTEYLVMSVFGEFEWPGRVTGLEFIGLRGKSKTAIDEFHATVKRGARGWVGGEKRVSEIKWGVYFISSDAKGVETLQSAMPTFFDSPVNSPPQEGWDDLLRLEYHNEPCGVVDSIAAGFKTLGDAIKWAELYSRDNFKRGFTKEWQGPLEDAISKNKLSYVVTTRMLRYAFRKLGFPTRIVGFDAKDAQHPSVGVRVYVPAQGIAWTFLPGEQQHAVSDLSHESMEIYPHMPLTKNGRLPVFDINIGGEQVNTMPLP